MRVALVSHRTWGLTAYACALAPEFDVLEVSSDFITYDELASRYPADWRPDAIVCWSIDYMPVPLGIENADCFTAGIVGDWNMASQSLNCIGNAFDVLLADRPGCDVLSATGFASVRPALLYGFLPEIHRRLPDCQRDIDVLFIGNFNQSVQAHRAPWLARLAQLSSRHRVLLATNVHGNEFTKLMNRARIVFNRSIRGELNQRAYEAMACGALMFLERDNVEVDGIFADRNGCVLYGKDDLEELLTYYLEHEDERAEIAEAGYRQVQAYSAEQCLRRALQAVEVARMEIGITERPFRSLPAVEKEMLRAWQWVRCSTDRSVEAAAAALTSAEAAAPRPDVLNAGACLLALTAVVRKMDSPDLARAASDRAVAYESRALALFPDYAAALCNLGQVLYERGELVQAEVCLTRCRSVLSSSQVGLEHVLGPYFRGSTWTTFDVEIERAWNQDAFGTERWVEAVRAVLLWHTLLMLNDIALASGQFGLAAQHAQWACELLPVSPIARARLAVALLRTGDQAAAAEAFCGALDLAPMTEWIWLEALPLLRDTGHPRYEPLLRFATNIAIACPSLSLLRGWLSEIAPEVMGP